MNECRICGSPELTRLDELVAEHPCWDCSACCCLAVEAGADFHKNASALNEGYRFHQDLARRVSSADKEDLARVGRFLRSRQATDFAFESIFNRRQSMGATPEVLDVGCSTGYMVGYLREMGIDCKGVDISQEALEIASRLFGRHFSLSASGLDLPKGFSGFDIVYSIGTVGCVEHPLKFVESLLALVKPGGQLVFNTPSRSYVEATGEAWVDTLPPDLITLFPTGFWESKYGPRVRVDYRRARLLTEVWRRLRRSPLKTRNLAIDSSGKSVAMGLLSVVYHSLSRVPLYSATPDAYGQCVTISK